MKMVQLEQVYMHAHVCIRSHMFMSEFTYNTVTHACTCTVCKCWSHMHVHDTECIDMYADTAIAHCAHITYLKFGNVAVYLPLGWEETQRVVVPREGPVEF